MILIAAASIGFAAAKRLIAPLPLENVGLGLSVSIAAALVKDFSILTTGDDERLIAIVLLIVAEGDLYHVWQTRQSAGRS